MKRIMLLAMGVLALLAFISCAQKGAENTNNKDVPPPANDKQSLEDNSDLVREDKCFGLIELCESRNDWNVIVFSLTKAQLTAPGDTDGYDYEITEDAQSDVMYAYRDSTKFVIHKRDADGGLLPREEVSSEEFIEFLLEYGSAYGEYTVTADDSTVMESFTEYYIP